MSRPSTAEAVSGVAIEHHEIATPDGVLHALRGGEPTGTPVLLLHGMSSNSGRWVAAGFTDALTRAVRRWIALDVRGHGASMKPYGTAHYRLPALIGDVLALLDGLSLERVDVVGYSFGGHLAGEFAVAHPDRVRALVLIGSAVSGAPDLEHLEPGLEDLEKRYDAAYEADDHDTLNALEAEIWLDGPFHPGRVTGSVRDLFLDMNRIALEAPETGERRDDVDAWQNAAAVAVPTLVMVGEYDLDHTQGGAVHLAATIPGARLVELPGVAHLPHLERDPLTLREIAGFVAGI